ncbi:MAG: hypothetical protein N2589_06480 [bacterium]|nr:hypothetical protein [bacterium]
MEKKRIFFLILISIIFSDLLFSGANDVVKIVSGKSHTLILTKNGDVFGFGWNKAGQIGFRNDENSLKPTQIKLNNKIHLLDIIDIGAGDIHSIALRKNGVVLTWGGNFSGQLGNLTYNDSPFPVIVREKNGNIFNGVIKVAAGWDFSVVLKKDGTVWTWGDNKCGQLGDGSFKNRNYPIPVRNHLGKGYLKDIIDIKAGAFHILALSKDGTVWSWGNNEFGQLGDGSFENKFYPVKVRNLSGRGYLENIVKIECGAFHSLAIDKDGNLYAWGKNWKGQLGDGTYINRNRPIQVLGENGDGFLKNVVDVSAGRNHTIALNRKGEIFVWGGNVFGQLGNLILKKIYFPIRVYNGKTLLKNGILISAAGSYCLVLLNDGNIYFWGVNEGEIINKFEKSMIHLPHVIAKF